MSEIAPTGQPVRNSGSLEEAAARVAELSAELECVHEALAAERFGAGNG